METVRKIIHIDMDAFFASVEQKDNPQLKGKPVIVGGNPKGRGVVAACSYEARRYGVRSAMPSAKANRLCPSAVFVRPRLDRYREVSGEIMNIFQEYTDLIEPLSLDEAFLDVTENKNGNPSASLLAREICQRIVDQTGLTASAGVSCNKFLAKVSSDINKPNGITVITPDQAVPFLDKLPVGKFFGVGKVTEQKMNQLGIKTGLHLRQFSREDLIYQFGKSGSFFYDIVRGIDTRPVEPSRERKSIGNETTFQEDIIEMEMINSVLESLAGRVGKTLMRKESYGLTLTLKVRYFDFSTITRSITVQTPISTTEQIIHHLARLIPETEIGRKSVRLLGLSVSKLYLLKEMMPYQLPLPFPDFDKE